LLFIDEVCNKVQSTALKQLIHPSKYNYTSTRPPETFKQMR